MWSDVIPWFIVTVSVSALYENVLPLLSTRFEALSFARRRYVIKNVMKSVMLLVLAVGCGPDMIRYFWYKLPVSNSLIHAYGLMYAIPDIYALYWVGYCCPSVMARSTVYHHVSVGVLALLNLTQDYTSPARSHYDAMLFYAYLSMLTGIVNFYLGIRFLLKRPNAREDATRRVIASIALVVYVLCCAVNWAYQVHTIMWWIDFNVHNTPWSTFCSVLAYCGIITIIVKDDVELIQFLVKERRSYMDIARCVADFLAKVKRSQSDNDILSVYCNGEALILSVSEANIKVKLSEIADITDYDVELRVRDVVLAAK